MASSIDVKLLSCKDIHSFTFFQKLSVYALASLGPADAKAKDRRRQLHKSPVSCDGGNNPEWNHHIAFDLEEIPDSDLRSLFLEIDLLAPARLFSDKLVGEVRVPLTDLLDGADGSVIFVSYQVRSASGKPNGVFSFSYQVNLKGGAKIASYPTVEFDPPLAYPTVDIGSPPAVYYLAPPPPPPLPAGGEAGFVPLAQPMYYPPMASAPPAAFADPYVFQPAWPHAHPPPEGYPAVAPAQAEGPWVGNTWRDRGYGGYFSGRGWR
ncbi:hypothetical protein ACLOJK_039028 [Asimina triloba]